MPKMLQRHKGGYQREGQIIRERGWGLAALGACLNYEP